MLSPRQLRSSFAAGFLLTTVAALLALCPPALSEDESEDEEAGRKTIRVELKLAPPSKLPIKSAIVTAYFEGPSLNVGPWSAIQPFPVNGLEFSTLARKAGRAAPVVVAGNGATAEIPVPVGATRVWIDVGQVALATRTSDWAGSCIRGPIAITNKAITVELPRGRSVSGKIVRPRGAAVTDVTILATPIRPHWAKSMPWWAGLPHAAAIVEPSGEFHLEGLGDGEYVLEAELADGVLVPPALQVGRGTVAVTLKKELLVGAVAPTTFKVVDLTGKPVSGARIRLFHRSSGAVLRDATPVVFGPWRVASASGAGRLPFVVYGQRYTVALVAPSGRSDLKAFTLLQNWAASAKATWVMDESGKTGK